MRTIPVTSPSSEVKRLLDIARKEALVLRAADGQEFVLSAVDDFEYELSRQRGNKKLVAFLDRRFRAARKQPGVPLAAVARQLGSKPRAKKPRRKTGSPSR
jgi:hypothetical protein